MTVKDAIQVLKHAKDIRLAYAANCVPFDHRDTIMIEAYGDYVIDEIRCDERECYEIAILMRPVKKEV